MTPRCHRSAVRSTTALVGLFALATAVAGCAAPAAEAAPTPVPTVTVTPAPVDPAVTAAESCAAFSDVLTILHNATVAQMDGRIGEREFDGWMRLATRVLDRVPISGEGAVSDAITALQQVAPPVRIGAQDSTTIGSPEWYSAAELAAACEAAGAQLSAEGWVGG